VLDQEGARARSIGRERFAEISNERLDDAGVRKDVRPVTPALRGDPRLGCGQRLRLGAGLRTAIFRIGRAVNICVGGVAWAIAHNALNAPTSMTLL
jgi:hypothetical protein